MNNPPAFPNDVKQISERAGMTLRDYFAAKAMQQFLEKIGWNSDQEWFDEISQASYRMADTMLKAREQ
jgi:hypothetical protein